MLIREANEITGGLSETSKMNCWSHGLPAEECPVGSQLVDVEGSTCSGCYALKGFYKLFPSVSKTQYRRLAQLSRPDWCEAMALLINKRATNGIFRWHDSGDVQGLDHLSNIVKVCQLTPDVRHWLPTREYKTVKLWRQLYGEFPANLVVRLSAHMRDTAPPTGYGLPTSTVVTDGSQTCPAPKQENECRDCRACWDPEVRNIAYAYH